MIASFTNRFIFLKTRKTGGTSIALVLSTWCSPPDVLSPLYGPDEAARRDMGGCAPTPHFRGIPIKSHMSAAEVRDTFPDLWDDAYKISVERHPYEKVVSRAYWNIGFRGGDPETEIGEELERSIESDKLIDRDIYCIEGQVAADEVILHGSFDAALQGLARRFGRLLPPAMPRAKSQFRTDRRPAAEILTGPQKRRIRERTAFEFELFGFEP